jgi:hypothetical protein
MRLITGVFLNEANIRALAAGSSPEDVLSQTLTANFPFRQVQPSSDSEAAQGAELASAELADTLERISHWLVAEISVEIPVAQDPLTCQYKTAKTPDPAPPR